ncbi:MAG: alpha/beta hydrolase [Mycobacteriales bacterium]
MPLDPDIARLLESMRAAGAPPLWEQTAEQNRASYRAMVAARSGQDGPPPTVGAVDEVTAPGPAGEIPLRVYHPAGEPEQARPGIVFFHGGGWVVGDLDTHDAICRNLCATLPAVVVSVDYRRGPEDRFPAAVLDAVAAVEWVAGRAAELGIRPEQLVVSGDSAGGNLAAVAALHCRDAGGPPLAAQMLFYPATDATLSHPSIQENATGYYLETRAMRWYVENYAPDADSVHDPRMSPLVADLAGLPAAVVATAEFDPLRDEGDAYAAKLAAAGVPVVSHCYPGLIHGFLWMGAQVPAARVAVEEVLADLRRLLAATG